MFRTKADYARGFRDNQTIERIERELDNIPNEKVRAKTIENLAAIKTGSRDFRF